MSDTENNRIYLDYASSTPVRQEVIEAMEPYWQKHFANPQAVHTEGKTGNAAIEASRNSIAEALNVQSSEIVFTSGATEANSLALIGSAQAMAGSLDIHPSVLIGAISHPSIKNIQISHKKRINSFEVPVNSEGRIQIDELLPNIKETTAIISISHANSEIGTLQPVSEIVKAVKSYRRKHSSQYPFIHLDASQSALYKSIRPETLGVDLLTVNSQKLYGPKGVGLLWIRSGTPMAPLFLSDTARQVGDYQRIRPGTPPVPLIVGMEKSVVWAQVNCQTHSKEVTSLQDYFTDFIKNTFTNVRINGSLKHRIPHNISLTFPDIDHGYLATQLDQAGIAVATTSACQARYNKTSSVVARISDSNQAIRLSLGLQTTKSELNHVIKIMQQLI